MAGVKGLNKHQRNAFKEGEQRISGDEIWRLVDLSKSKDPLDRLEAADNLCPCHVRRRIDEVWEALYGMLEDPELKVRKAAYHTLTDGGNADDPDLDEVFERASRNETDPKLRKRIEGFLNDRRANVREREGIEHKLAVVSEYAVKGKCDFCGEDRPVREDYDTQIPGGSGQRAALVCEACDG
jgi:hypothetical protein